MSNEPILELYQYIFQVSSGKVSHMPPISNIAREVGITRQAVYDWIKGRYSCPRLASYMKDVTGVAFPEKLDGSYLPPLKTLLHIS